MLTFWKLLIIHMHSPARSCAVCYGGHYSLPNDVHYRTFGCGTVWPYGCMYSKLLTACDTVDTNQAMLLPLGCRLIIWFFLALPAVREWYEFIDGRQSVMELGLFAKLGPFAWIAIAATCLETMVSVKFGQGLYPAPWPRHVLRAWGFGGGAMVVGLATWQLARLLRQTVPAKSQTLFKADKAD